MQKQLTQHLRRLIAIYAKATRRREGGVWGEASGNGNFGRRLDQGATFTVAKYDEIVQWCSDNWPDGVQWLESIERPTPKKTRRAA